MLAFENLSRWRGEARIQNFFAGIETWGESNEARRHQKRKQEKNEDPGKKSNG
jgi:hypothetical protein